MDCGNHSLTCQPSSYPNPKRRGASQKMASTSDYENQRSSVLKGLCHGF